jgi:hypothetical protein
MNISIFKLCKELLKISVDYIPTDPLTKIILKAFIESVSEQTTHMSQKLDRLIGSHYRIGLKCLRDVETVSVEERGALVREALREFRSASEVEETDLMQMQSKFYVGVCYNLLGQYPTALTWYEDAYRQGCMYEIKLRRSIRPLPADLAQNVESSAVIIGVPAGFFLGGPVGLVIGWLVGEAVGKVAKYSIEGVDTQKKDDQRGQLALLERSFLMPLRELLQSRALNRLTAIEDSLNMAGWRRNPFRFLIDR